MNIESDHPPIPPDEGEPNHALGSTEVSIEPKTLESLAETADQGRTDFLSILRDGNIRSLVRYIEDAGIKLDDVPHLSPLWKARFKTKRFQSESYTWRNPKLYLLTTKGAAAMAIRELLARLSKEVPPHAEPPRSV